MNKSMRISLWVLAVLIFSFNSVKILNARESDKYPSKSINFIVPAGAGGSLGNEIRAIMPFLEKNLGVKTTVEYVTGADGMIAYNKIYKEKPDGYSIIYFNLNSAIALELSRDSAKYVVKNYTPIASWNSKYHALVCNADTWKNFSDFFNDAKQRKISMTLTGGSATLQGYLMETALGIKFNFVPYASSGESLAAIAGKHVEGGVQFSYPPRAMIRAGKLRALAVFSKEPDPVLPGVPSMTELGHSEVPALIANGTFAAPPNTPKEIVAVLEKAISQASGAPELNKMAETIGIAVGFKPTSELKKLVLEQYEFLGKYKHLIK